MPVTRANDSSVRDPGRCGVPARGWRLALFALCVTLPYSHAGGVHVALLPATVAVSPGDALDLQISVTEPGLAFNACGAVIGFDPSALTFLPTSPLTLQEGSPRTCSRGPGSTSATCSSTTPGST
jgi:hypothetical protein